MAKKTTETTPQTPDAGNVTDLGNGQVDNTATVENAKADYKALQATLKAAGIDSKGMYTEFVNDPDDVKDTLEFLVKKNAKNAKVGITQATMDAALVMFAAMQATNAPKIKPVKVIPDGIAEDFAQAWFVRQQVMAEYNAAKLAVEKLWAPAIDASKSDLDAARAAVHNAGFGTDMKTGLVKTTKTASTTNGEHGNAGKTKLSIGWTIQVGTVTYSGWKDVAQKLVPSVYKGETNTNYLSNTPVLEKVIELGLPVEIWCKIALKDHDHDAALEAWGKSAAKAKLDAHPSVTVHVS